MNADYFRRLIDYTFWANSKVWECVDTLTEAQFNQPSDYSIGSVQQQVVHQMNVERLWFTRIVGEPATAHLEAADYPTRPVIRQKWDEVEAAWRDYMPTLKDSDLEVQITFTSITTQRQSACLRWEGLMQTINHSTDHRAQILSLIHQVGGQKTVPQDFIYYVWNLEP